MSRGFFGSEVFGKQPEPTVPACGACRLYKKCLTPKMAPQGRGVKKILIVGDRPHASEDKNGRLFTSEANLLIHKVAKRCGVDIARDCWVTNALICHSGAPPKAEQIRHCNPNLAATIQDLNPVSIITTGWSATHAVIRQLVDLNRPESCWYGWHIPSQKLNAWVLPVYGLYDVQNGKAKWDTVPLDLLTSQLEQAFSYTERPWHTVPDWKSEVKLVYEEEKALEMIKWVHDHPAPFAFDYETNMLKPEGPNSRIFSCSICWKGKLTFAFHWSQRVAEAMSTLLQNDAPKIASNLKFEDRWTRAKLGHGVNNWEFDTMLAAHWEDSREGITSLKFQSFVRLGFGTYNAHIESFLEGDGTMSPNRIHMISPEDLLLYNGLDSLLEYKLSRLQQKETEYVS